MADISQINLPTSGGSTTYDINAKKVNGHTVGIDVPANAVFTDTKNTAGSTDTSSKIFLVGATSQANNPQTYSDNEVYVTSGTLTSTKSDTKAIIARTGSGTAGSTSGTKQTPSLWTFNSGITVANGEIYFIKIPVAGGTYGVWLSLNNGANYYPVAVSSGKSRFTTHYAKDTVIAITYESGGKCTCYPKAGGNTTSDVTGIFRVLNDYDANTTYSTISVAELTTGTATTSRTVRADYLKSGVNDLINAKVWTGTQEQYDAITTPDPTVTYYITDDSVSPVPTAAIIYYDSHLSGLNANTVQSAIDNVSEIINVSSYFTPISGLNIEAVLVNHTIDIRIYGSKATLINGEKLADINNSAYVPVLGMAIININNGDTYMPLSGRVIINSRNRDLCYHGNNVGSLSSIIASGMYMIQTPRGGN